MSDTVLCKKNKVSLLKDMKRVLLLTMLTTTVSSEIKNYAEKVDFQKVVFEEKAKDNQNSSNGVDNKEKNAKKKKRYNKQKEKADPIQRFSMHTEEMKSIVDDQDLLIRIINSCDDASQIYQILKSHICKMSEKYGVPYDLLVTIIHQESGGTWNTNGVCSYTDDYGLTQINACNLEQLSFALGFTKEDILNNPFKAIEAQAYLLKNIIDMYQYDENTINKKNVCGTYNGWTDWQEKEISINYANSCMEILENNVDKMLAKKK